MSEEIPQILASQAHEVAFQDVCDLVQRHISDGVSALELLAIASNLVGKIIAFQDQRQVTPARAMRIVEFNIEIGNQQALERIRGESSGRA